MTTTETEKVQIEDRDGRQWQVSDGYLQFSALVTEDHKQDDLDEDLQSLIPKLFSDVEQIKETIDWQNGWWYVQMSALNGLKAEVKVPKKANRSPAVSIAMAGTAEIELEIKMAAGDTAAAYALADAINDFAAEHIYPMGAWNACSDDRGFPVGVEDGVFFCFGDLLPENSDIAADGIPDVFYATKEREKLARSYQPCWIDLAETDRRKAYVETEKKRFRQPRNVLIVEFDTGGRTERVEIECFPDSEAAAKCVAAAVNLFGDRLAV